MDLDIDSKYKLANEDTPCGRMLTAHYKKYISSDFEIPILEFSNIDKFKTKIFFSIFLQFLNDF